MPRHPLFIASLRRPLIDLAIGLLVLAGAGLYRYQTQGLLQIAAAQTELEQTREETQAQLVTADRQLQEAQAESRAKIDEMRRLQEEHSQYLASRIDTERGELDAVLDRLAPFAAASDSLAEACVQGRDDLRAQRAELDGADEEVRGERLRVEGLERSAAEGQERAREILDRLDGPGRHGPARAVAFAALLDRRAGRARGALRASRDLLGIGPTTLGLLVSAGVGGTGPHAALEGGAYWRLPLGLARWALELSAGWAGAHPFYGATLGFAPLRGGRVRILGGFERVGPKRR